MIVLRLPPYPIEVKYDVPETVGTGQIAIEGDAYAAWGTDDDYLYTYTATALGLTIIEIVPDAPPAPPVLPDGAPVVDDTAVPVAPSVADSEEPK